LKEKQRILIVDDNEELCHSLSDILELENYKTTCVFNGHQAIETLKTDSFKIILLDIKMPGLSGIETLQVIKEITPTTPLIIITAFADDILYKEGLRDQKVCVIQKPIDIALLFQKIGNMLSGK